jgi:hypothetical protein
LKKLDHIINGFPRHYFSSPWAGINMTVQALLVAQIPEVNLQGVKTTPAYRWKICILKVLKRI